LQKQQKILEPYAQKRNAFNLTITPDRADAIYHDGDYMSFLIYAERDCYFTVTEVDVYGNTKLMYPKPGRDNNFIKAGETRRIPDKSRYRVRRPYGVEYIIVAAYEKPVQIIQEQSAPLSNDILTRLLEDVPLEETVVSTGNDKTSPAATALFSYSILANE
jgi:hypothetical protein